MLIDSLLEFYNAGKDSSHTLDEAEKVLGRLGVRRAIISILSWLSHRGTARLDKYKYKPLRIKEVGLKEVFQSMSKVVDGFNDHFVLEGEKLLIAPTLSEEEIEEMQQKVVENYKLVIRPRPKRPS